MRIIASSSEMPSNKSNPVKVVENEPVSFFTCSVEEIVPIVVSVNMSDYLEVTLNKNRKLFTHYIVVTDVFDQATKDICKKYNVRVIEYDNFYPNDAKFNKSGAVRHAQAIVHREYPNNWIILLDTDIVLPENLKDLLKPVVNESKKVLYSLSRYEVMNNEELEKKYTERKYGCTFVGYFQMYFDKTKYYPSYSYNASKCDAEFSRLFDDKRMLNEFVFHLGVQGANWNGRSSKTWC